MKRSYIYMLMSEAYEKLRKARDLEIEAGDIVAGDFGAEIARARINFCPMCGRKLKEADDGND